jgi:hypothetical protein
METFEYLSIVGWLENFGFAKFGKRRRKDSKLLI